MRGITWFAGVALLTQCLLSAHDPATTKLTWTGEISRLIEKRCVGCHQEGGVAPMPLRTYSQARPWAVAIKDEVLKRTMPPWPAAKGFGEFSNDISLPQEEINRIAEWVVGGAPEGEQKYLKGPEQVPVWKATALPGSTENLEGRLARPVTLLGLRGFGKGKIWAELPDGSAQPLVWWLGMEPKLKTPLSYRQPVRLPAGTVIHGGGVTGVVR